MSYSPYSSVCILFFVCLSPLLISHFLTCVKPKRFHMSDLKLAGASAITQTLLLGNPHHLQRLKLDLYKRVECKRSHLI